MTAYHRHHFTSASFGERYCLSVCQFCGTGETFPINRGGLTQLHHWENRHVCSDVVDVRDTEHAPPPEGDDG